MIFYKATGFVAVIVVVWLLVSCSDNSPAPSVPQTKLAFNESVQQLRERHSEAEKASNGVMEKTAEAAALTFLRKTPHRADGWVATVDSVSAEGEETVVTAKQDETTFHLVLFQPSGISAAASLARGDRVDFSGDLGEEQSLTTSGALREPEFRFYPESLTKQQTPIATQSRQAIATNIAENKATDAARHPSLDAEYTFEGGIVRFRNVDKFPWRNCRGEINSHGFSYGYEANLGDTEPGELLTIEPNQFANQDGERFNSLTHKLQSFWLDCDTPKGRGSTGFQAP